MTGPPGSGKSTLAIAYAELLEGDIIGISIADSIKDIKQRWTDCDSKEGLIIADDLPELRRDVLGYIKELSANWGIPVIATMYPCPCGYLGDRQHQCLCTPPQIAKYRTKISGSVLEIFDMHIEVPALSSKDIMVAVSGRNYSEPMEAVKERIMKAREVGYVDSVLDEHANNILETAIKRLGLSMKAVSRIVKTSRAIANLDDSEKMKAEHISEAIQYRIVDRSL